jgi:hypothetical protein
MFREFTMNSTILRYRLYGTEYTRVFGSMKEAEMYVFELLQTVGGEQIEQLSLEEGGEDTDPVSP